MKTQMKLIALILVLSLCCLLGAGCAKQAATETTGSAPAETTAPAAETAAKETAASSAETTAPSKATVPETTGSAAKDDKVQLYIGTEAQGYTAYDANITGEVTPEKLIAAIEELTGWNLSLADQVATGKGGMSVDFSPKSALVVGPPNPQKDAFHMPDVLTLTHTILDSVQETLQRYYVMAPGDPNKLDIFFTLEGKALTVNNVTLSLEDPWDSKTIFK